MIDPALLHTLRKATGDRRLVATPAGRPGKWVIGLTTAKAAPDIRRDLEGAGVNVLQVEWVAVGEYVVTIDQWGGGR